MNSRRRFWVSVGIIIVVIIVNFFLSVEHTRDLPVVQTEISVPIVPRVSLRDVYKKGVHTLTGSILAPDACTTLSVEAAHTDSAITLALSLPEYTDLCLEVPTLVKFNTTVTAPANLPITLTVNGALATTTP